MWELSPVFFMVRFMTTLSSVLRLEAGLGDMQDIFTDVNLLEVPRTGMQTGSALQPHMPSHCFPGSRKRVAGPSHLPAARAP